PAARAALRLPGLPQDARPRRLPRPLLGAAGDLGAAHPARADRRRPRGVAAGPELVAAAAEGPHAEEERSAGGRRPAEGPLAALTRPALGHWGAAVETWRTTVRNSV